MRAAASKTEWASHLVHPPSSCKPCSSAKPTNKNRKKKREKRKVLARFNQLYLSNHLGSDTCSYELFLPHWLISLPKILTIPPEAPCIVSVTNTFKISQNTFHARSKKKNLYPSCNKCSVLQYTLFFLFFLFCTAKNTKRFVLKTETVRTVR
jgi:hypothetical protein